MRLDHLLSKRKVKWLVYNQKEDLLYCISFLFPFYYIKPGDIAQLARASALQAEGQGFESPYLQEKHKIKCFFKKKGKSEGLTSRTHSIGR